MKAKHEGAGQFTNGVLKIYSDDGEEIATLTVAGLANITEISKWRDTSVKIQQAIAAAINAYREPVTTGLLLPSPNRLFRHYKGGVYEVRGISYCSETLEPRVQYFDHAVPEKEWSRPAYMWYQRVGTGEPRFKQIDNAPAYTLEDEG